MAHEHLSRILTDFCRLARSKRAQEPHSPHKKLFLHALITGIELRKGLDRLEKAEKNDLKSHQEYLELLTRLEALIKDPGSEHIISDSIYQISSVRHDEKSLLAIPGAEKLNDEQRSYFREFLKFQKIAINKKVSKEWIEFALSCCQDKKSTQKLAKLIMFYKHYGIEEDWLNLSFIRISEGTFRDEKSADEKAKSDTTSTKKSQPLEILKLLEREARSTAKSINDLKLTQTRKSIHRWNNRIQEWADPKKFEALYSEFNKEIIPLIESLSLKNNMAPLAKKALLKTVQDLVDMMDKTIKSLKGSPEYNKNKIAQVHHFYSLLKPFHFLMNKWVNTIPDEVVAKWNARGGRFKSKKEDILKQIAFVFNHLEKNLTETQLNASKSFSVSSVKIDSGASFDLQFRNMADTCTLEDLFSLFHQNVLVCTVYHAQDSSILPSQMPEEIQPLLNELTKKESRYPDVILLNSTSQFPNLHLEFNVPLGSHSVKFTIDYNKITHKMLITNHFFGGDEHGRINLVQNLANKELKFLGAVPRKNSYYQKESMSLEFSWEFSESELRTVGSKLVRALKEYCYIMDSSSLSVGTDINENLSKRYPDPKDQLRLYENAEVLNANKEQKDQSEQKAQKEHFLTDSHFGENLIKYLQSPNLKIADIKKHLDKIPNHWFQRQSIKQLESALEGQGISHSASYQKDVIDYLIKDKQCVDNRTRDLRLK